MTVFLLNLLTGVLLSFLVQLVGGWYLHYLPAVAVAHALLVGVVYALLRSLLVGVFRTPRRAYWTVTALAGLYFYVWLVTLSQLLTTGPILRFGLSLVLVVAILALAEGARTAVRRSVDGWGTVVAPVVLLLVIGGVLILKGVTVGSLPFAWVDETALKINPITTGGTTGSVRRIVYPFSLPMEDGLTRYRWLTGEANEGSDRSGNHVVVVVLDTLRDRAVGSSVNGYPLTPTIDAVAEGGVRFDNYYVQGSWTKPSTASLFTGRYLREHGTFLAWNPSRANESDTRFYGQELPDRFRTLPERLREEGYGTFGAVSISHISSEYQFNQGFDAWFDPIERSNEIDDYAAVQRLLFWMYHRAPEKSFSYLHFTGPHYPFAIAHYNRDYWRHTKFHTKRGLRVPRGDLPDPSDMATGTLPTRKDELNSDQIDYIRHLYGAKLNVWDRKIVRPLLEGLEASGVLPGNHLVVTGDHGEELYDYRRFGHMKNLREPVISPPLIVRGPGFRQADTTARMVESIDLTSTILDAAGADTAGLSGESFADSPTRSVPDSRALAEMGRGVSLAPSITRDRITFEPGQIGINVALVREGPWKLYHQYGPGRDVLIDLPRDPGEFEAVGDHPEVTERLRGHIFKDLGSDSALETTPPPLIRAGESQLQNLEGLGYL